MVVAVALLAAQDESDPWDWVGTVQERIWKDLRQSVEDESAETREMNWKVLIEANDGWGETAVLRVWHPWEGRSRARLLSLKDDLPKLLHDIRVAHPKVTAAEAAATLPRVRSLADCTGLDTAARQLAEVRIPALPENYLALHASGFRITLTTSYRQERSYSVDTNENDLARWAQSMLNAAEQCEAR